MNDIKDKIDFFGSVLIQVYSQYDPDKLIDSVITSDYYVAEDMVLYYPNDYTYVCSPE